jgi:excisionase family DNA binding protein
MYAMLCDENTLAQLVSDAVTKAFEKIDFSTPAPPPELEQFISREAAAVQLGVSLPTLDKALRSGAIRSNRIGRRVLIPKTAVNAYASR